MKFLVDFLPILLFFLAYKLYDIYVATAVAIVASVIQVVWSWFRHRKVENIQWITMGLIVVLGGLTLLLKDENNQKNTKKQNKKQNKHTHQHKNKTNNKKKPTLVNWLFAVVFLGSQYIGSKSVLQRMMAANITLPEPVWHRLNWIWVSF